MGEVGQCKARSREEIGIQVGDRMSDTGSLQRASNLLSGKTTRGPQEPPHRQGYDRHITTAPIVVFLGAGASAALGKPMMSEFIKGVRESLPTTAQSVLDAIIEHRGYDLEDILEDLQAMEALSYVRDFQIEEHPGVPPPIPRDPRTGTGTIKSNQPAQVRKVLEHQIITTYRSVPADKAVSIYGPFLDNLFSRVIDTLPVFTTNYDPAIECLQSEQEYRVVTGFHHLSDGSSCWDRQVFDSYSPKVGRRNIVLFKLHGFADWVYDTSRKRILFSATPLYTFEDEAFQNRLIYPARRKVAIEDPYATAYDYFQRCCDHAKLLIVIGYSFRDYDALTRLRSSLTRNQDLRCVYIGPHPETVLDERGLNQDFRPIPYRFGSDAESLALTVAISNELDDLDLRRTT
jgi:hypothetical protein